MGSLASVSKDGFSVEAIVGADAITVKLTGSCDSQTTSFLERYLADMHTEVVRLGLKKVTLDCESLYFMNASSVRSFVLWLSKVKASPPAERYHVRVRTNRYLAWHGRSFGAIARSAPEVVTID